MRRIVLSNKYYLKQQHLKVNEKSIELKSQQQLQTILSIFQLVRRTKAITFIRLPLHIYFLSSKNKK